MLQNNKLKLCHVWLAPADLIRPGSAQHDSPGEEFPQVIFIYDIGNRRFCRNNTNNFSILKMFRIFAEDGAVEFF
ncbi:hypothetical protein DRW42_02925 [Pedobacter miscanthi]|uniref:Uncharacterized protein n=1 Tax=Pedobacter miscanthi TaxID=2259170 RepID=A0A366LE57_9SPHI|nr:hypothetical protein DRW42_02925 [Pedobacter miscanthi]